MYNMRGVTGKIVVADIVAVVGCFSSAVDGLASLLENTLADFYLFYLHIKQA